MQASGPRPAVMLRERVAHVLLREVDHLRAPARAAMASRAGTRSMAITRAAPRWSALRIANSPTGPQPHTATTSPGWISQFSAAM